MIQKILESAEWTSANPTHTNTLIQVNAVDNPDFEQDIKTLIKENKEVGKSDSTDAIKETKQLDEATKQLKILDKGNVGDIQRFTSTQIGNVKSFATDPTGFIVQTFVKKFARGIGVIAFAVIIFEAVKWIIGELLKPGRLLDVRFKRDITKEIIAFRRREDQQKIRQGFSSIIITTQPRLRGGQGQVTNTLDLAGGRGKFPDSVGQSPIMLQASGVSKSKSNGRRSGRGPGN